MPIISKDSKRPSRPQHKKSTLLTFPTAPTHVDPTVSAKIAANEDITDTDAFRFRATEITQFKVFCRVRPFITEELAEMEGQERRSVVEMTENRTILLDPKDNWSPKAQFEFDASLWSIPPSHQIVHTFHDTKRSTYATQRDIYQMVAKDLVPHVFDGFNSCILTYGQTGSGKTYTMMGIYNPTVPCGQDGEEGIIPRVSNDLFTILADRRRAAEEKEKQEKEAPTSFRVEVSFVEIYMERVRDLLDPSLRNSKGSEKLQDARIRQDPYSGPFVEGVTKYQVENWAQCCILLERGSLHRTTCATAVHNQSSRSHAIFQLTVIQEKKYPPKDRYAHPVTKTQAGRINLVDLAGSERGGFQNYVKESAAINTSLLALRRVIDNLTERQNILMEQAKAEITGGYFPDKPLPQVPFRDSVLTWLLSDSIGGNARTTMIATLSPLVKNYGDTLATLQWSSKARNLVTLVKVNEQTVVTEGMTHRAGELSNAVRIQRQNLDSLRETLQSKQTRTVQLDSDCAQMQKTMAGHRQQRQVLKKERAALLLQRALRNLCHRRRLAQLTQTITREGAAVRSSRLVLSELNQQHDALLKESSTITQKHQALIKEASSLQSQQEEQLQQFGGEEGAAERQAIETAFAQVEAKLGLLRADGQEGEKGQQLQEMRRKVEEGRLALNAAREKLKKMENKKKESQTEEWRVKLAMAADALGPLKEEKEKMRIKRDAVRAECDAERVNYEKICKKKAP